MNYTKILRSPGSFNLLMRRYSRDKRDGPNWLVRRNHRVENSANKRTTRSRSTPRAHAYLIDEPRRRALAYYVGSVSRLGDTPSSSMRGGIQTARVSAAILDDAPVVPARRRGTDIYGTPGTRRGYNR